MRLFLIFYMPSDITVEIDTRAQVLLKIGSGGLRILVILSLFHLDASSWNPKILPHVEQTMHDIQTARHHPQNCPPT